MGSGEQGRHPPQPVQASPPPPPPPLPSPLPAPPLRQANLFLLATCYHRCNQSYRAYHLLKGLAGEQSRYLFAVCALALGKLTEAETALLPDNDAARVRMRTCSEARCSGQLLLRAAPSCWAGVQAGDQPGRALVQWRSTAATTAAAPLGPGAL